MRKGVSNNQLKALAIAMAGATFAAVATMFVPVAMLETFTGATGLSELVPAAAAPLGDTARALIAFGAGVFTLAALALTLLRKDRTPQRLSPETAATPTDETQDAHAFKDRLVRISMPKMPWSKGDDDITELADLPKLRNGDSHPDAPPRRPLSAQQDLPVLDAAEIDVARPEKEHFVSVEADGSVPLADIQPLAVDMPPHIAKIAASNPPMAKGDVQPTLAEMVAQLEVAVAERQQQLAELEAVAAQLDRGHTAGRTADDTPVTEQPAEPQPVRIQRQPLEAVPAMVQDDDMDSALAAALATLQRMNGTDR